MATWRHTQTTSGVAITKTEAGDVYYGVTDEEGTAERIYTIEPSKLVVEWWVTRPENNEKGRQAA